MGGQQQTVVDLIKDGLTDFEADWGTLKRLHRSGCGCTIHCDVSDLYIHGEGRLNDPEGESSSSCDERRDQVCMNLDPEDTRHLNDRMADWRSDTDWFGDDEPYEF